MVQTPPASASTSVVSTTKSTDEQLRAECASKQSLIETVTNKFQQATGISSGQGSGTFKRNDSRTDSRKKRRGSMAGKYFSIGQIYLFSFLHLILRFD